MSWLTSLAGALGGTGATGAGAASAAPALSNAASAGSLLSTLGTGASQAAQQAAQTVGTAAGQFGSGLQNVGGQFLGNLQNPELARAGLSSPLPGGIEVLGPGMAAGTPQGGAGFLGGLTGRTGFLGPGNQGISGHLGAGLGSYLNQRAGGLPGLSATSLGYGNAGSPLADMLGSFGGGFGGGGGGGGSAPAQQGGLDEQLQNYPHVQAAVRVLQEGKSSNNKGLVSGLLSGGGLRKMLFGGLSGGLSGGTAGNSHAGIPQIPPGQMGTTLNNQIRYYA